MIVINAITGQLFPVEDKELVWQSIRKLAKQGKSAPEIADELVAEETNIRKIARKYRIKITPNARSKPSRTKPFPEKRLRRLVSQGLRMYQLVMLLSFSKMAIRREMNKLGLKLLNPNASLVIEMPPGVSRFAVNRAVLTLQRDGHIVYPAALFGGPQGRWCVNSRENEMDAARMVAKARRLDARGIEEGAAHG